MLTFGTSDLQRKTADVQRAALNEPVVLTYHDKPRFVLMTVEEYARMEGVSITIGPESLPESAVARLRALADAYPEAECEVSGGLAHLLEEGDSAGGPRP